MNLRSISRIAFWIWTICFFFVFSLQFVFPNAPSTNPWQPTVYVWNDAPCFWSEGLGILTIQCESNTAEIAVNLPLAITQPAVLLFFGMVVIQAVSEPAIIIERWLWLIAGVVITAIQVLSFLYVLHGSWLWIQKLKGRNWGVGKKR